MQLHTYALCFRRRVVVTKNVLRVAECCPTKTKATLFCRGCVHGFQLSEFVSKAKGKYTWFDCRTRLFFAAALASTSCFVMLGLHPGLTYVNLPKV